MGRQERTAVESPSINFHARIIIGKLESWLPDSRFVSPNESERVGAQRRAVAGSGGSFRLYAASSKSSMLRRAIIIVSLASFSQCRSTAAQQTRIGAQRVGFPLSKPEEGAAAGGEVLPSVLKRGPLANSGRLRAPPVPPSAAQFRALAARPPVLPTSPPTSDSCGSEEFTRRRGLGGGSPNRAGGLWPAFCETHTGLRKRTHRRARGELLGPVASHSTPTP